MRFRANRACTDHVCTLRIILEQITEMNGKKYFHSINREVMWKILNQYKMPDKHIRILKLCYDDCTAGVEHDHDNFHDKLR